MDTARDHDSDFVGWTESQAAILKNLPRGAFGLDAENLAEEIADLGRTEVRETSSLLRQVLVHLIKLAAEPGSEAADHWVEEALAFQGDAVLACTPGIRQRVDIPHIWKLAANGAVRALERHGMRLATFPTRVPFRSMNCSRRILIRSPRPTSSRRSERSRATRNDDPAGSLLG